MNIKSVVIIVAFVSLVVALTGTPGKCEGLQVLSVCQELVNQAASYEARASYHRQIARSYQTHIENLAKLPSSQVTSQALSTYFDQYDQNRALENKFKDLYRQASDQAKKCMKSVD